MSLVIALLALFATAMWAWLSRRQVQLNRLVEEFQKQGYFQRFWLLDMHLREPDQVGPSIPAFQQQTVELMRPEDSFIVSWSASSGQGFMWTLDDPAADALRAGLGPGWHPERADFATFYYLILRIAYWAAARRRSWGGGPGSRLLAWSAGTLTDAFGPELVLTMHAHRRVTSRLHRVTGTVANLKDDFDYFRVAYGLRNGDYEALFDALVGIAIQRGLLTEDQILATVRLEKWLQREGVRVRPFS